MLYTHRNEALGGRFALSDHYTNKSVKEIAFDLGYSDPRSLQKLFKKISGHSPSTFKNLTNASLKE